jgi:hypothetical protein
VSVGVANVTVSPTTPTAGDTFQMQATLRNYNRAQRPVTVDSVVVERNERGTSDAPGSLTADGDLVVEDRFRSGVANDLGTLPPGAATTISWPMTADEPGWYTIDIIVHAQTGGGVTREIRHPVTVHVVDPTAPQLDLDIGAPPVGDTPVNVTVSNGDTATIRSLSLQVRSSTVTFENPRRQTAVLEGGTDRTFTYTARLPDAVSDTLTARLRYTTANGERRTVSEQTRVTASGATHPQVEVAAADAVPGGRRSVNVTVANGLDRAIESVAVHVQSPAVDFTRSRRVQARLAGSATSTLTFPATVSETGSYPVNVTVRYTDNGVRRRVVREVATTFDAPPNPGELTLTSVDAVRRGGDIEVSATASNVGTSSVSGAIVAVGDTQRVAPAEYFVGGVEGSDFASFTMTTTARGNVSTIPLTVTYVTDGVEQSRTREVRVERGVVRRPDSDAGGGGLPLVHLLVVAVVVAAAVVLYRRRG